VAGGSGGVGSPIPVDSLYIKVVGIKIEFLPLGVVSREYVRLN